MPGPAEDRAALLRRARALDAAYDGPGVVALLSALPEAELIADPDAAFLLATALRRTGQPESALALTHALAGPHARTDRLGRLLLNLEAALHFDAGRLDHAASAWRSLIADASRAEDDASLARANNNLGIVLTLQGRFDEALTSYGRALAAHQRRGDRPGIAQAHSNLGICYRELGFHAEADRHFDEAIEHGLAAQAMAIVGRAEEERAAGLVLAGDAQLAAATASRAARRLRHAGDPAGVGEALRVLGLAAMAESRRADAHAHLDEALTLARSSGTALLEAETLEALAALEDDENRRADAARIFESMGAAGWGRRIRAQAAALAAER